MHTTTGEILAFHVLEHRKIRHTHTHQITVASRVLHGVTQTVSH